MPLVKHVWKNRDNDFVLLLDSVDPEGVVSPIDGAQVTSVLLELENGPGLTVAANDADAPIDWWSVGLDGGEMRFMLGDWASTEAVPAGNYRIRLTLYSLNAPDGIVWASFAQGELSVSIHDT